METNACQLMDHCTLRLRLFSLLCIREAAKMVTIPRAAIGLWMKWREASRIRAGVVAGMMALAGKGERGAARTVADYTTPGCGACRCLLGAVKAFSCYCL